MRLTAGEQDNEAHEVTDKGNILTVGDAPNSLAAMLTAEGYQVRLVDSGEAAVASFTVGPPDLILLDILLPDMDGFEFCRRLKAQEKSRHIPLVFLSAASNGKTRAEGLTLGAVDFIDIPFSYEELMARIRTHLAVGRLYAWLERRAAELQAVHEELRIEIAGCKRRMEELKEMSLRDELTGLYNRRGFAVLAEQELKAAIRVKRKIMLTFLDVDGLKGINDTLGHEEGDRALRASACILRHTFRASDIIARIGGDEFIVLAIDVMDSMPEIFLQRLQRNIADRVAEERRYQLALSWGTVIFDPQPSLSLDQLMSEADKLMYTQKRNKAIESINLVPYGAVAKNSLG